VTAHEEALQDHFIEVGLGPASKEAVELFEKKSAKQSIRERKRQERQQQWSQERSVAVSKRTVRRTTQLRIVTASHAATSYQPPVLTSWGIQGPRQP